MHDECLECIYGEVCPEVDKEDGECKGEWHFKAKTKATEGPNLTGSTVATLLDALINAWDKKADDANLLADSTTAPATKAGMKHTAIVYDICAEQLRNAIKGI